MPATQTLDLGRLEKAAFLRSRRSEPGLYVVEGSREPHTVDIRNRLRPACSCADHTIRGHRCKHIMAALLREGDRAVLDGLRELITSLRAAAK
jgi:hypothetical protein